jgi:serine/threonine protein kinase
MASSQASVSSPASVSSQASIIVGKKYKLLKKIGEGSFGKIYLASALYSASALDSADANRLAIKISTDHALVKHEVEIYETLKDIKNVPSLFTSGTEGKFSYLVLELLEKNLEQLVAEYGSFQEKVLTHLGIQMLKIIENIHARGIIHSDIKPANFLLKTNAQNISELYLIDFGLASRYIHRPCLTDAQLIGTVRYMSLNIHKNLTASRRDDIESLGYTLMYLHQGQLPWQNKRDLLEIIHLKEKFQPDMDELWVFVRYGRKLDFNAQPNYAYLRGLLELKMI